MAHHLWLNGGLSTLCHSCGVFYQQRMLEKLPGSLQLVLCPYGNHQSSLYTKENVSIITHDCDLEKLFPGDPLIAVTH